MNRIVKSSIIICQRCARVHFFGEGFGLADPARHNIKCLCGEVLADNGEDTFGYHRGIDLPVTSPDAPEDYPQFGSDFRNCDFRNCNFPLYAVKNTFHTFFTAPFANAALSAFVTSGKAGEWMDMIRNGYAQSTPEPDLEKEEV